MKKLDIVKLSGEEKSSTETTYVKKRGFANGYFIE